MAVIFLPSLGPAVSSTDTLKAIYVKVRTLRNCNRTGRIDFVSLVVEKLNEKIEKKGLYF